MLFDCIVLLAYNIIIAIHMGIYYWLFSYLYDTLLSQMLFVIQWIISDISYNQHNPAFISKDKPPMCEETPLPPSLSGMFPQYGPISPESSYWILVCPSVPQCAGSRQGLGANSWVIILSWADWEGRREGWLTGGGSGSVMERQDVVLLLSSARCISHQSIRNSEVKKLE